MSTIDDKDLQSKKTITANEKKDFQSENAFETLSASSMDQTQQFLTIDQPPTTTQTIDYVNQDIDHKSKTEKKHTESNRTLPDAAMSLYDAMPLLSKNTKMLGGAESNGQHVFRHQGFGKYRNEVNMKQRVNATADEDGEDTDGQYDSGVDADGNGTNVVVQGRLGRGKCKHRTIKDHHCIICGFKMTRFGSFFDSGQIPRYMRILAMSDSEECMKSLGREMDLIYESYNPTNIIQIRDHILTVVGRSLISQVKKKNMGLHAYTVLPTEALYRDTLQHGKTYKQYLKDFLEQKRSVMKSDALYIDSQFESGNIEKVFKSKVGHEYQLFMNVDTNTRGHQQWFYFRIRNIKRGKSYKFNILNFTKPKSLYRDGMGLMWMSRRKAKLLNIENDEEAWEFVPAGNIEGEITYSKSRIRRGKEKKNAFDRLFDDVQSTKEKTEKEKEKEKEIDPENQTKVGYVKKFREQPYYQLSFTINFDYNNDTVFIAYSRPYKYSQIILDLLKNEHALMEREPEKYPQEVREQPSRWNGEVDITLTNQFQYSRKLMCLTLSGLPVPILTVTACKNVGKKYSKREAVIVTSRVHPGETNSSFVFQGLLEMICKPNDPVAQSLRENYIFKLIPCLNPDGVAKGNYRSSFAGVDLNRQWILPNEFLHPTIFHAKKEFEKLYKERPILLYCDLHGHSRKQNSFIYGCNRAANGGFNSWTKVRLLPRILARNNCVFDINACKFKVEKSKMGTGRIVVWKDFEVTNSFTLENSFHGYDYAHDFKEFTISDFKKLGADIILSLNLYQKILIQIQKELNLTRGWLKPKRLLEVTGKTAKENLIEEAKERKKQKKTIDKTEEEAPAAKPSIQANSRYLKPPKGPIVNSRAGPSITLQGLIDQYVFKNGKKDSEPESSQKDVKIGRKTNSAQRFGGSLTLNSKTINMQNQKSAEKRKEVVSPGIKSASTLRLAKSKSPPKNEDNGNALVVKQQKKSTSKEEKLITDAIIKIQAFFRMNIAKNHYLEMQTKKQEEELGLGIEVTDATQSPVTNEDSQSPAAQHPGLQPAGPARRKSR